MVRKKSTSPRKEAGNTKRKQPRKSTVFVADKAFQVTQQLLYQISKLQTTTKMQIPKLCFARLVREIMQSVGGMDYRIQGLALSALQEAAEMYLVHFFEDSNLASAHARRITLMTRDMQLVKTMRARYEPFLA